ncbi:hypothetical protein B0H67DRAFT_644585 [Lasiosphaeris hirsuta]|uniref:Uncharacterized protein n=1 Tax=Lasiosphaeris hirsuta TaxID=260670 RepID=A0AA40AF80_9PEZI|nr:hypothetical protein B0H67DRAFT_644585 [Lasiosphaeris hirsuta]
MRSDFLKRVGDIAKEAVYRSPLMHREKLDDEQREALTDRLASMKLLLEQTEMDIGFLERCANTPGLSYSGAKVYYQRMDKHMDFLNDLNDSIADVAKEFMRFDCGGAGDTLDALRVELFEVVSGGYRTERKLKKLVEQGEKKQVDAPAA